tara:strand:+ start:630 stop:1361 length:732 start_codon:yes stop_codon:yes gene_type:complete
MNRSTKKLVYGLFYLVVFAIIGLLIFLIVRPREQGPAAVGVPTGPRILDLMVQESEVFRLSSVNPAFLFARVSNPNEKYRASHFSYSFLLYGFEGELLEQVSGEANVLPREETILYETSATAFSRDVQEIRFYIVDVEWSSVGQSSGLEFSLPSEPQIEIDDEAREMRVKGEVRNDGGSRISEARVVVALRDSFGFRVFVSGTILSNLRSFASKDFVVSVPYDEDLVRRVRDGAVEVFLYPVF